MLKLEGGSGEAPVLNVFGGKLTTYRRLGESALEKIGEAIGIKGKPWTAGSHLPGGDFAMEGYADQVRGLSARYPFLPAALAARLVRQYGTEAGAMLGEAKNLGDLGRGFGADLYECEVRWLMVREWARTAEDILWRRTKLGLRLSGEEAAALEDYLRTAATVKAA